MKIKDLIKHLQTLDQEKQLVIIATDPTDWDYGVVITKKDIKRETIYPHDENGLEGSLKVNKRDKDYAESDLDRANNVADCYVIRMDV